MPTDEQLRERFEEWEQTEAAAFLDDPDHCNYSLAEAVWLHAWLARDAEVQALKEELLNYVSADEMAVGEGYGTYPKSEHRRIRALVAGGETGETE